MENPLSFEKWFSKVDDAINARTLGLVGVFDIADQTWHDWFNDGISSQEAADMALENEGFFDFVGF